MRKVATCVGVSATALYRHYANRDELLFQVLLQGFRLFADYLNAIEEVQKPCESLQATVGAYLHFALNERGYYEVMFMSNQQVSGLSRLHAQGADEMQQTFGILQRRVQRAMEEGCLGVGDSREVAFGIWAFAHGQIALYYSGKAQLERKVFITTYKRLMGQYLERV